MSGFDRPNYTQVPNELFTLIPVMKESELKVVLFAIRKTFGWQKETDHISISQFCIGTGLSRQGVVTGLDQAKTRGILVELAERGPRGVRLYKVVVKDIDQSKIMTSQNSSTVTSQKSSTVTAQTTSQKFRPTKETTNTKETRKEKTIAVAPRPAHEFNPVKDAIVAAFGWKPDDMTRQAWGKVHGAAAEIYDAGRRAKDIPALYRYCKAKYDNFGPNALAGAVPNVPIRDDTPSVDKTINLPDDYDPDNYEHYEIMLAELKRVNGIAS